MTIGWFGDVSGYHVGLNLAIAFGAGAVLGFVYFRGLLWNARLFADGARLPVAIGLGVGRFILLGGLLTAASLEGAMPLLLVALGVLLGRFAVMRRVRDLTR